MTLELDPTRTALLLVDPYNDFLADDGRVWPRVREVAEAVGLRRHLRDLVSTARTAGVFVVVAPHRRFRRGDVDGWRHARGPHRTLLDGRLFEVGTRGGEWYPGLEPQPGDVVCTEHWGLDGFAHTDLDQQLRQHGVQSLVLAGMTAPGCVEGTGRHAAELGYSVVLVQDATASFSIDYQRAATELTGPLYAEAVVGTDAVIAALSRPDAA